MHTYRPTYDYVTDERHLVDPALVEMVIEEAESYTRADATSEPALHKLGGVATTALVTLAYSFRHFPFFFGA